MTETRNYQAEIRASEKGNTLIGTAVVYNSPSQELYDKRIGKFTEIIKPGALRKTLESNAEVTADLNHDTQQRLGKRSKGTLILHDTPTSLRTEISPPDTTWGRDAIEAVKHGDYDGMSFEFTPNDGGERFYRDSLGKTIRELSDITLKAVSIVSDPAYRATNVELRSESLALAEKELGELDWKNRLAALIARI